VKGQGLFVSGGLGKVVIGVVFVLFRSGASRDGEIDVKERP
jgi:hypothetical protein